MVDVFPDSRLKRSDFANVKVDWRLPDGRTVRVEVQPVFCANCGRMYGFVPKANTTFAFWLCAKCYEAYGDVAGTCAVPDAAFAEAVEHEMVARFGRALTAAEVFVAAEQGKLGSALEKLEKESPYPR